MINYISKPFRWFFKLEAASGLVLLFAAIIAFFIMMVGVAGFEPATLWSQTRCATRLRYTPIRVLIQ